ncbi:MAG: hypothetical protein ACM3O6_00060 [Acidobacteriota bacterium]
MVSRCIAALRRPQPEPTLAELLADPIMAALMKADRVDPRDLAALALRSAPKTRTVSGAHC